MPNKSFSFITFENERDQQEAMKALHGLDYRKSNLNVVVRQLNESKKRPGDIQDDRSSNKRSRHPSDDSEVRVRTARDAVCPWWNIPYKEQLVQKTNAMEKDCLKKCFREVKDAYWKWNKAAVRDGRQKLTVPSWITTSEGNDLSWVEYCPIIASPEPVGYRNKCEFTFGIDSTDKSPAVGFRVSTFSEGVLVGSPQDCPNISKAMKLLVKRISTYLREMTTLKVYDMLTHTGNSSLLQYMAC